MLKKVLLPTVALMVSVAFLAGCAAVIAPAMGTVYTETKAPMAVTSNSGYTKVGTAYCHSILGIVALGDASIKAAMENGGITKIHHVDYKTENILGIYAKLTVIVYGE